MADELNQTERWLMVELFRLGQEISSFALRAIGSDADRSAPVTAEEKEQLAVKLAQIGTKLGQSAPAAQALESIIISYLEQDWPTFIRPRHLWPLLGEFYLPCGELFDAIVMPVDLGERVIHVLTESRAVTPIIGDPIHITILTAPGTRLPENLKADHGVHLITTGGYIAAPPTNSFRWIISPERLDWRILDRHVAELSLSIACAT